MANDNDGKKKVNDIYLDAFVNFMADPEGIEDEAIETYLQKSNIDVPTLVATIKSMVDKTLDTNRLSWQAEAVKQRELILDKLKQKMQNITSLNRDQMIEKLHSIHERVGPQMAIAFRDFNPDNLSDDDLREMISNLLLLDESDG